MENEPEFLIMNDKRYRIADIPDLAVSLINKINAAETYAQGMVATVEAVNAGVKEMRKNFEALLPDPIVEPSATSEEPVDEQEPVSDGVGGQPATDHAH